MPGATTPVLFDLLTALLDSWTLWIEVAGEPRAARRWREQYLALTFNTGRYVPYESLVARAAEMRGLDPALAQRLTQAYGQLRPWPEFRACWPRSPPPCRSTP